MAFNSEDFRCRETIPNDVFSLNCELRTTIPVTFSIHLFFRVTSTSSVKRSRSIRLPPRLSAIGNRQALVAAGRHAWSAEDRASGRQESERRGFLEDD